MSNALDSLALIVAVTIPCVVELSVNAGVPLAGCLCPSSLSATVIGTARWQPAYRLPVSPSTADAMTFLIVEHMIWMGPLFLIFMSFLIGSFVRMNHPAARDCALGRTR